MPLKYDEMKTKYEKISTDHDKIRYRKIRKKHLDKQG